MTILLRYAGHGLAPGVTVTTATAGEGDTPPAVVQGIAPITRHSGVYPVRFEFDQGSPITQPSYLVWAHTPTNTGGWGWYQNTPSPGGGQRIATAWSGADAMVGWTVDVNFAGVLVLGDAGGTVDTGTISVADEVEYRVGVTYNAGAVQVNLYAGDSLTPLETLTGAVADRLINEIWWGNTNNAGTAGRFRLDSLIVQDVAEEPGPYRIPGVDQNDLRRVRVEFAFGANPASDPDTWTWTDASEHLKTLDGIQLRYGRADETSIVNPGFCGFALDNESGDYTPDLATSQYYPNIRLNTPVRTSVILPELGVVSTRFRGNVAVWLPEWPDGDLSEGTDLGYARTRVTAAGERRRLGQGSQPLQSALRRAIPTFSDVVAYWPMEDAENATQFFSPISGVPSMIVDPDTTPAAVEGPGGSDRLPSFAAGEATTPRFFGGVPFYNVGVDGWRVDWLFRMDEQPASLDQIALRVFTDGSPVFEWRVTVGDDIRVIALDQDSSQIYNNGETIHADFFGGWVRFILHIENDGTDLRYALFAFRPRGAFPIELNSFTDDVVSGSGQSPGRALSVGLQQSFPSWDGDRSIGHITVTNGLTDPFQDNADDGYAQEFVAERLERLCAEENVPFQLVGVTNTEPLMGPQRPAAFLSLLDEAAAVDGGILGESLTESGLLYRDQASLYNQPFALVLDASQDAIANPFSPPLDDQRIRNDITLGRVGGSEVRIIDQQHIDDEGHYPTSYRINVDRDEELVQIAGWRLHLGTWPGMRYPAIAINLDIAPDLIPGWLDLRLGDRIAIINLPPQHPTDGADLIVEGWSETITPTSWRVVVNCSPAGPHLVNVLGDDVLGRLDTDGSELAAGIDDDDTSLSVTVVTGPLWSADPADAPFDIIVGGEIMTVTDITGASSPQTFTVTRSVNGVVKSHSPGTGVNVWPGFRLAL